MTSKVKMAGNISQKNFKISIPLNYSRYPDGPQVSQSRVAGKSPAGSAHSHLHSRHRSRCSFHIHPQETGLLHLILHLPSFFFTSCNMHQPVEPMAPSAVNHGRHLHYNEERPLLASSHTSSTNNDSADNHHQHQPSLAETSRRLYLSHFLSTCNSRVFEFGSVLYLASTFPSTLLPMSVYAMVRSASAILLSSLVGQYIDREDRLKVVRLSIGTLTPL